MGKPTTEMVRAIEKAVNTAFFKAGLKTTDLYAGPIKHTTLPWQCPPLKNQAKLLDIPLEYYFVSPIEVDVKRVHSFWVSTLRGLYIDPSKVINRKGEFKDICKVFGQASSGQHRFRFSIPSGFPRIDDPYAGAIFSLEVADVLMNSTTWIATRTGNDYYITTPEGLDIGVKAGRPATESGWDADCSGMVWEFLAMPRGQTSTVCLYDPLDKLRSLLHENHKLFKEFEAVDYALQALRMLYRQGHHCTILHTAVTMGRVPVNYSAKEKALKAAVATMERIELSGRSKIAMLYSQLVPIIYSESAFSSRIYNMARLAPFTLSQSVETKISNRLEAEIAKLPLHLQEKL